MRYHTFAGLDIPLDRLPPSAAVLFLARQRHGPQVTLWRRFRDGTETREVLPEMFAEWTLAAIPECEPDVARARIER